MTTGMNALKGLGPGAILSLFLSGLAPAQTLEWIKPSLIGLPSARCCASMVYDPAMGATLLYGGDTYNTLFGDTWSFSKSRGWTQLTPATSPPPLAGRVASLRRGDQNGCAFRRYTFPPWSGGK